LKNGVRKLIQFENICKGYGEDLLLEQATFALNKREKCALVGRNGAGKTTIFRLLTGQEEPDSGTATIAKNYRVGYLQQHIHFTSPSVLQEACLGLLEEEKESIYKAEAILSGLGFSECDFEKQHTTLSGGYHLRLHLAKLLLSNPDCLLLDEPTNYLDILSIRWLSRFLQGWQKECIVVSHDRQFLDSISTHTLALHRKKVLKVQGATSKLYQLIAQQEEIHEKTRVAIQKKREKMQQFIDRFGAKNTKAKQAQSRAKAIERLPELEALCALDNLSFEFPTQKTASEIILKAKGISFSYTQEQPLISNLSFELEKEARVAIIGKNGKGKSTLLKLLAKELAPQTGALETIQNIKIGYFGQTHIGRLHLDATVEEEIASANPELSVQEVRAISGKMLFTQARAEKKICVLSGGEKSRVVLAKLLACPHHLLLLDEPTNHLDIESMEAFMEAIEEFAGAVVMVTHSELVSERMADELIIFRDRGIERFSGNYSDFLQKGGWQEEEATYVKKESTYKQSRRERAEAVQARSKLLKPLLTRIKTKEEEIILQEKALKELQNKLLEYIQSGNHRECSEINKTIKEKEAYIEELFASLDTDTKELVVLESIN
jgi:ATP-binding cassette subfamily F protein 3